MTINVNNTELYYEVCGSGAPLIMVHGNGEDHTIFEEAAGILRRYFTCYLVDTRGHGQSAPIDRLHYRDMAQDYIDFIKALGLTDVTFFGFSDGGIIGLLAGANSDVIDTLIISGANTVPDTLKAKEKLQIVKSYVLTHKDRLLLMLLEPDITAEELSRIKAKTFVIAGEDDMVKQSDTDFIAESIPGAKEIILPGETHGSHIVHSTKIADIILRLTGKVPRI